MVNLFYLDHDPKKCAKYYCDKHVVKIPVEICQILSQIYHELGTKKPPYKRCKGISFNLNTYLWAKESVENYKYCTDLAMELLNEYKHRYNKTSHKSEKALKWLQDNVPPIKLKKRTKFKLSKNIEIYNEFYPDVVKASRLIYVDFKCKNDRWSKREKPKWFDPLKKKNQADKLKLKNKIMYMVRNELPDIMKDKDVKVKRFHSFLRVSYDEMFQMKWDKYIKQYPNMFSPERPLIHQLGIAHLKKLDKIVKSIKKIKTLKELNQKSLEYRGFKK